MLYFFYGTDAGAARAKARARLADLQKECPNAGLFRMEADSWDPARFGDLLVGQGLFGEKSIIHLVGLFENEEAEEEVVRRAEEVSASPNLFVAAEGEVGAETLRAIKKHAGETTECKKEKAKPFNPFGLADALAKRDKKNLWMLYRRAIMEGLAPENINGVLFWKVKSLLTASYPSRYWKTEELKNLSHRLVALYHDSHRGRHDFEIALERLTLTI